MAVSILAPVQEDVASAPASIFGALLEGSVHKASDRTRAPRCAIWKLHATPSRYNGIQPSKGKDG